MKKQIELIHGVPWDYLIVLDACRFDYFKEEWNGECQEVESPSFKTIFWLKEMFPGKYPFTVYSANPLVNSLGKSFGGYKASEHFDKIVDLWDFGWSDHFNTVLPSTVYSYSKQAKPRSIIWFLQPHMPHLDWASNPELKKLNPSLIGGEGKEYWNYVKDNMSFDDIKQAYRSNLREALKSVEKLVACLNGKVVVTSDHGELLGEYGQFGHIYGDVPELRKVPWVEMK